MTGTSRLGQVKVEGDHATLTFERSLPYPPEDVWKAITDPGELSKWYMSETRIDGRVGGSIDYSSGPRRVTGSILAWDPPRVFEHEWKVDRPGFPKGEYGVIRWELVPEGEDTILKLTHRNLPGQTAYYFASGTHAVLDRLEAYLNGTPMPDWMTRSEELRKSYVP
ncbi:MAG: SRPBCC family protein [Thaumarchaeota archaeon]|nr:SRPBCC family protein [Nitrososphaerota archaeon]